MPLAAESLTPPAPTTVDAEIPDTDWLTSLKFRHSTPAGLAIPARQGDVAAFSQSLPRAFDEQCRLGKRERVWLLASLSTLWTQVWARRTSKIEEGSLAHCLFDQELNDDELSGRVEAIMASTAEGRPDRETLVAAHWLLRMAGQRLEPQTRFTFFRWTMDSSREWLEQFQSEAIEQTTPTSGCAAFDFLEIQTLSNLICPALKGSRKQHRQNSKAWRAALDAITDSDGTPHARWLNEILPRFCQLTAVNLFADSLNAPLWDRKSHRRLEGLLARVSLLVSPRHVAFSDLTTGETCRALLTIAEILHLSSQLGLLQLLSDWEGQSGQPQIATKKEKVRAKLPKVSVQSDWGDFACLRSAWSSPVNACWVRHDGETPQLEVVTADFPLFAGAWSHELKIAGQSIPATGEWTCCCWYLDEQAAFMELQLNRENPIQIIRQALLLRKESVLMLSDSIRTPEPGQIEFKRTLPLAGSWNLEEDTLSREVALVQENCRVRVFPWSGPQMRLERSDESMQFRENQMQLQARTQGQGLFTATLFDWSGKRREEPVDWQRVTVAEDGQYIPPEVAVGHRLRIGKKQWLMYHSHRKPAIPRSVLGVHTLSESVFARLSSQGEVEALVEVEL